MDTISIPDAAFDIDTTDFLILKCLDEHDIALWKKRIHKRRPDLFDNDMSVQTVGRRVDRLHEQGLVETCIVSPDDIKRDLIIAYQLTDAGKQALRHKRRELLLNAVHPALFDRQECGSTPELERQELIDLMGDELQIEEPQNMFEGYTQQELVTLLSLYFVQDQVQDVFTPDRLDDVSTAAADHPELSSLLNQSMADMVS